MRALTGNPGKTPGIMIFMMTLPFYSARLIEQFLQILYIHSVNRIQLEKITHKHHELKHQENFVNEHCEITLFKFYVHQRVIIIILVTFAFEVRLQGVFSKMSQKNSKTAEKRVKMIKIGLFRPKIT